MDPVVAPRRGNQDRRIRLPGLRDVVGRDLLQEGPVLRDLRVAVFGDPARAGEQLGVAAHVDQRHGAEQRAEALGIARQHVGDEEAAVRAALGGDASGCRHAAAHQVGGHRREVVVGQRLALAPSGLVPAGAELAAAADVGDHPGAALGEPEPAEHRRVAGEVRHLEAAIAREVHRRLAGLAGRAGLDVGDALAVARHRLVPGHHHSVGLEQGGCLLEQRRRGEIGPGRQQGRGGDGVVGGHHQVAVRFLLLAVHRPDADDAELRQAGDAALRPPARRGGEDRKNRLQVVEDRQDQVPAGPEEALQRPARTRGEQHLEVPRALQERVEPDAEHAVGRMRRAAHRPRRAQADGQEAAVPVRVGIGRNVEAGFRTGAVAELDRAVEEAGALGEDQALGVRLPVGIAVGDHAGRAGGKDHRGVERVGAAPPQPHGAGVARRRRVLRPAERARQQQRVGIEPDRDALGFRQREAVRDEGAGLEVELAHHRGVAATAGELDERPGVAARQARGAAPHPVLALVAGQRVEVEEHLPGGIGLAVLAFRRAPPQAAGMPGILPQVVEEAAAPGDARDLVGPVERGLQAVAVGCVAPVGVGREGVGVLRLDPGQRPCAVDLLEPEIRVVVRGLEGRAGIGLVRHAGLVGSRASKDLAGSSNPATGGVQAAAARVMRPGNTGPAHALPSYGCNSRSV